MKSFVIYNPYDELSKSLLKQTIDSCLKFGINPEEFEGTFEEQIEIKLKKYNLGVSPLVPKITKGAKGCFVSHYELWKKSVDTEQALLILEHDVLMINRIPNNILNSFDDILNLDSCGSKQKDLNEYTKCINRESRSITIGLLERKNTDKLTWKSVKQNNVSGAYSYIIKPSGAKKLINAAEKNGFLPTDVHINSYYLSLNIVNPSIFRICDFMLDRKNRVKFSSTKGYLNGKT
jgi:GR25 family glycosyltransferase involved in LPS biosynthesis